PERFRPGLDPRPVREKYGLDAGTEGGAWLLTVSRVDIHKGIDTVIRALPAVRAAVPSVRYVVAGVGSRRPEFERLAAALGVGDAVRFLGFVGDDELPALYNAADLYVGASRRYDLLAEGFGISIVEASACGLAVVGGRSGGVPDAVRDGETGILVDPDDPEAVAAADAPLPLDAHDDPALRVDARISRLRPLVGMVERRRRGAVAFLDHLAQVIERERRDVLDARMHVIDGRCAPGAQPYLEQ